MWGRAIVAVVLTLTSGCTAPPAQPPNILLITIDTLRADRVGRAGLTPTLDALAARGTRFTRAYAHAPTTLASHASMLTGLGPPSHGVRNNGAFRLADSAVTLAEVLKGAGYATGAFVSAFVLDGRYGLGQGFDVYDDRMPAAPRAASGSAFRFAERRAPETLQPAAAWIAQQRHRWFAWVHLFDPHAPYAADDADTQAADGADAQIARPDTRAAAGADAQIGRPDTQAADGAAARIGRPDIQAADGADAQIARPATRAADGTDAQIARPDTQAADGAGAQIGRPDTQAADGAAAQIARPATRAADNTDAQIRTAAIRAYDREVAYVDAALARFLAGLGPVLDRTIVIVTADHGESLGEHGESTHGLFAYDATLRVPLIVTGPGVEARVAPEPVSHVDLMPTVLELTGTRASVEGQSLVDALKGFTLPGRPIYFEAMDAALTRGWAPLTGIVDDGWKYVDLPLPELYDLDADAGETSNRVEQDAERTRRMRGIASRMGAERPRANASTVTDADARARLRALGYTSGGGSPPSDGWREENDPKRLLPLHTRFQHAADLATRDREAAIRELRSLIGERPDFAAAYEAVSTLLMEAGRPRDAVTVLSAGRARGLRQRALTERLGAALLASGDARGAIATLEPAAALDPNALDVRYTLALAYISAANYARARETLTTILRLDPASPDAWTNLGTLDLQRGALREAQEAFEHALDADDSSVPALKGLGASLEASDPARAAQTWDRALALAPDDHALLARLAFLLAKSDLPRAKPYLERLIQEAPDARFAAEKRVARQLLPR